MKSRLLKTRQAFIFLSCCFVFSFLQETRQRSVDFATSKITFCKMKCGGTGSSQPADEETQQVIDLVKSDVEQKIGKNFTTFKAVEVARQLVQGVNFFVKVDVGEENYIHLCVYRNLPCYGSTTELNGILTGKSKADEVGYFKGFQI